MRFQDDPEGEQVGIVLTYAEAAVLHGLLQLTRLNLSTSHEFFPQYQGVVGVLWKRLDDLETLRTPSGNVFRDHGIEVKCDPVGNMIYFNKGSY